MRRLLDGEGEIKLNPEVLKEMEYRNLWANSRYRWSKMVRLDFNTTLPKYQIHRRRKLFFTLLRPYTATTKYNWDPVYQKKIKIDKDTWRGSFYELKYFAFIPIGQKSPLDKGLRKSIEIEAN